MPDSRWNGRAIVVAPDRPGPPFTTTLGRNNHRNWRVSLTPFRQTRRGRRAGASCTFPKIASRDSSSTAADRFRFLEILEDKFFGPQILRVNSTGRRLLFGAVRNSG